MKKRDFISVKNFSKSFGKVQVISDLSFEVGQGEVFAFLGANGSGKTTTIRCLLDIYKPDSGELLIDGQKYSTNMAERLGYLPEERGLYVESKVLEVLQFFAQLKGLGAGAARAKSAEYLERVGLIDLADQRVKTLSSGQQQKIQLGITIINQPELLILDEPTKGLDPVNRNLLMDLLSELNNEHGTTILFSTHQMEIAERIADRLLMIKQGESKLYGAVNEVRNSFGENVLQLEFTGKLPASERFTIIKAENNYAELQLAESATSSEVISELLNNKIEIQKVELTAPSLQEIFVKVSNDE